MPKLYLIDGSGFIFRAFHSLPPLTRSDGTPLGAVYGFVNMLLKLTGETTTDYMAVVFDAGRQTFRNRLYPEYKAHRPPPPDDLIPQFSLIREATEAMNLPAVELADYEADDLIATYTRLAREAGMEVVIVSSDKDLMQLIGEGVSMYDGMKQKTIGAEQVMEKFGVPPAKVRDVLALIGDSSDNIPGVRGIGPKTAAELITQFGDVASIFTRLEEIKQPKRREMLAQNAENARLSYELIGLLDHVPPPLTLEELKLREPDPGKLIGFLRAMEFRSLAARLEEKTGHVMPAAPAIPKSECATYELVRDAATLHRWIAMARGNGHIALDIETTSPHAMRAEILGIALGVAPGKGCYIPLAHLVRGEAVQAQGMLFGAETSSELRRAEGQMDLKTVLAQLAPLFGEPGILKIGYNIKYSMLVLARHGIATAPVEDVMLLSNVLDAGRASHDIEPLAERHLAHRLPSYEEVTGTGKARLPFAELAAEKAMAYAAEYADITLRLWQTLKPEVAANRMLALYETIERPLAGVIATMERRGIKVDRAQLAALSADFAGRMATYEAEIYKLAGESFNIGSPKQLGDILFGKLGMAGGKKSKTGGYSTSADILEELAAGGEPLPALILNWRQLSKLKNTYTDALAHEINPETGRVHTAFAMAATSTGRLSSSDPNLQNIPVRNDEGRRIRHAFIAEPGNKLISADYSQIELRLLAHIADIPTLKEAFRNQEDIHAITASQMFGVAKESVNGDLRRKAKTINFGIIYGISAHGLAIRLGISRSEAATYIEAYFRQYPGIQAYMERTKIFAREHGYVTTLFGRRCHVTGIADKNPSMRSFSERAAINAPLQGTAADIIKRAMITVDRLLAGSGAHMLLQVHDELVIEAPAPIAGDLSVKIKHAMENAALLSVPLTVDTNVGDNWNEVH